MTEPHPALLDRDRSVEAARGLVARTSPTIREVLHHATWAFLRCQNATDNLGGPDEDIAAFSLYRHVIDSTDAFEVLSSAAICDPAIPLLRSAFEATVGLEYIMEGPYAQRSLSWLCGVAHNKLRYFRSADPKTVDGADFLKQLPSSIAASMPDPQADLRALVATVRHKSDYDLLYRDWSARSHAATMIEVHRNVKGERRMRVMRDAESLPALANMAVSLQLRATRFMLAHFRPEEDLTSWYTGELKPLWDNVHSLHVSTHILELP